jgi:hypothetical protein
LFINDLSGVEDQQRAPQEVDPGPGRQQKSGRPLWEAA